MATTIATMTPEQRRATAEALKVAREADQGRPVLRTLMIGPDAGYVTDSYRAVRLDWIDGQQEASLWDADALYNALKGAGKDWARLDIDGEVMTVTRLEPPRYLADTEEYVGRAEAGPGVDVSYVAQVEGGIPSVWKIMEEAFARVQADDYVPEVAPVRGDLLAALTKCHPNAFRSKGAGDQAVTLKPCGLKPAVIENGHPYAILMPVRVS